jgi:hypothetical protein
MRPLLFDQLLTQLTQSFRHLWKPPPPLCELFTMIQSLFIINGTGEVLIEKHWRGITSRAVSDYFWEQVTKCDSREVRGARFVIESCRELNNRNLSQNVPPVLFSQKFYLINIYRENLYFLAVVNQEVLSYTKLNLRPPHSFGTPSPPPPADFAALRAGVPAPHHGHFHGLLHLRGRGDP